MTGRTYYVILASNVQLNSYVCGKRSNEFAIVLVRLLMFQAMNRLIVAINCKEIPKGDQVTLRVGHHRARLASSAQA